MYLIETLSNSKMNDEDICLADSVTTYTMLKDNKYFAQLIMTTVSVNTISGFANLIEGFENIDIWLSNGTKLYIDDALYSTLSKKIC